MLWCQINTGYTNCVNEVSNVNETFWYSGYFIPITSSNIIHVIELLLQIRCQTRLLNHVSNDDIRYN